MTRVWNSDAIVCPTANVRATEVVVGVTVEIFIDCTMVSVSSPAHFAFASELRFYLNTFIHQSFLSSFNLNLLLPACWHAAFLSQIVPSGHIPGTCIHPIVEFLVKPREHVQSYEPSVLTQFEFVPHRAIPSRHSSMSSQRWRWNVWSTAVDMRSPWEW